MSDCVLTINERRIAEVNLSNNERKLLEACCACADGEGVPVGLKWKRVASSLTRKGLAWTMASVITVCIATDEGRAVIAKAEA